ncbi:MAG: hypothetical protein ACR2OZ_04380 [Verrucomicrobiales bacterium]
MKDPATLELALRAAAVGQLMIAVLGLALPRLLDWRTATAAMPLLVREVFQIHTWFIALTCAIFAALTWHFATALAAGGDELGRALCAAISIFWGFRSILQWTHYSSSHWRGKTGPTIVHWLLFFVYGSWGFIYAMAALPP